MSKERFLWTKENYKKTYPKARAVARGRYYAILTSRDHIVVR